MKKLAVFLVVALFMMMTAPIAFAGDNNNNNHKDKVVIVAKAVLEPTGDSGVTGKALLIHNPRSGKTKVLLLVCGLAPGTSHAAHIHTGSCSGPILHPLTNVVANAAGFGISRTVIDAEIDTENWWVNVHQDPGLSPGITCGKVIALRSLRVPVRDNNKDVHVGNGMHDMNKCPPCGK